MPKEDRKNAVYQLNCIPTRHCEAIYIGETKRTLNIRAEEQIAGVKSLWEHKKVLDLRKNWKTRTIKEAIYSEENEHHINGISFKLPNIWKPIL